MKITQCWQFTKSLSKRKNIFESLTLKGEKTPQMPQNMRYLSDVSQRICDEWNNNV